MSTPQSPSLLGIAAELRLRIYEDVLVEEEAVRLTAKDTDWEPGLVKVCRQLREEARPVYYRRNTFHFTVCNWYCNSAFPLLYNVLYCGGEPTAQVVLQICNCPEKTHPRKIDGTNLYCWLYSVYLRPSVIPPPAKRYEIAEGKAYGVHARNLAISSFAVLDSMKNRPWEGEISKVLFGSLMAIDDTGDINRSMEYWRDNSGVRWTWRFWRTRSFLYFNMGMMVPGICSLVHLAIERLIKGNFSPSLAVT